MMLTDPFARVPTPVGDGVPLTVGIGIGAGRPASVLDFGGNVRSMRGAVSAVPVPVEPVTTGEGIAMAGESDGAVGEVIGFAEGEAGATVGEPVGAAGVALEGGGAKPGIGWMPPKLSGAIRSGVAPMPYRGAAQVGPVAGAYDGVA